MWGGKERRKGRKQSEMGRERKRQTDKQKEIGREMRADFLLGLSNPQLGNRVEMERKDF